MIRKLLSLSKRSAKQSNAKRKKSNSSPTKKPLQQKKIDFPAPPDTRPEHIILLEELIAAFQRIPQKYCLLCRAKTTRLGIDGHKPGCALRRAFNFVKAAQRNKKAPAKIQVAGAWEYYNSDRAIYEAFRELLDWLNTRFTLLPKVGRIAMAARARKTSRSAYSTKSCPSSSLMNLFIMSIICGFPLLEWFIASIVK
jgi:hypothetical protein